MTTLEKCNPFTVTVYFTAVTVITMFYREPCLLLLSLLGAVLYDIVKNGGGRNRTRLSSLAISAVPLIVNPLVSHNGTTVLFVMNDSPITLEAFLYGAATSVLLLAMLFWFRLFTEGMTSDRLLYLFGGLSPRLALVLSMGLRYVPLFSAQAKKIRTTQTALGLYKDDNIIARFTGDVRVFSVLITWALENGIVTADSMTSRGYGCGKRSHYTVFRFRLSDFLLIPVILSLLAVTLFEISSGALDFTYYPTVQTTIPSYNALIGYISYGLLSLLPVFIEAEEKLKWKFLQSKI